MKTRVHVVGAGVISAIGNSQAESLEAFRQETSGIGYMTVLDSIHKNKLPVGEVRLTNQQLSERTGAGAELTRTALLGLHAAQEAKHDSGISSWSQWRTGFISGTTVGGMDKTEDFFLDFIQDTSTGDLGKVVNHACGRSTELIADALGVNHFVSTINTACSSSVNSIIYGARLIAGGKLDIVVAGGTDALTRFTLNGFNSLLILDHAPCRPFDANRGGLNLGEGAGYVVLVSDAVRKHEKLISKCTVSGFANTNDAFHQTASSPDGKGSFAAMQQALLKSGLQPEAIDYINLHGTATLNNDLSEGTAVKRLFGDTIPRVSSTKAFTGHTLGASGGMEAVFSVMAIQHQCVFPNLRFQEPIPEVGIVPQLQFEKGIGVRHVMSNSFGFGGNCSSIIFSAVKNDQA
ncbi:MAG: beta-ketoacyl-[acyl-carrier-protein] synthase family protein [Cyclobacteriaceae bacterium]|nr:beta-ketoacyl-[acyl-carrier-protein] synthase family protein [Cyclobacteriaceae bacterium]